MPERFNPPTLFSGLPWGFSQVATAGRVVAIAGQAAMDRDGRPVTGGFEAQVAQTFANVRDALGAGGAGPEHVVRATIYVVGLGPEKIEPIKAALIDLFGADAPPPNTLIGVAALALPELQIEVEALAILED